MKTILLLLAVALHAPAAPVPKDFRRPPVIDVRDQDGNVLIPAAGLLGYEWGTHTLHVKIGAEKALYEGLGAKVHRFAVCVDGKPAFQGRMYSAFLGGTYREPGIVFPTPRQPDGEMHLHIRAAYPNDTFARGDKRQVPELRAALEKAGKLIAEKK